MNQITKRTTSGLVNEGRTEVISVILTGGTDAATADVLDGTTSGGTSKLFIKAASTETKPVKLAEKGAIFSEGVYVTLTGTGPSVTVIWK